MRSVSGSKLPINVLLLFVLLVSLLAIPDGSAGAINTPWLTVSGRFIRDPQGNNVELRGVSLIDTWVADTRDRNAIQQTNMATDESDGWYARVVRFPVYPNAIDETPGWLANPDAYFNNHLDPAIQNCVARQIYCIIDWHYISDYTSGTIDTTTRAFWSYVAPRYANTPNVIFELFNEPVNPDSWSTWKATAQPWVNLIRSFAPNNLILIGGPRWSQNMSSAATDPFVGNNLVYVAHIYPQHGGQGTWDSWFGNASNTVPFFITEWGWQVDGLTPTAGTLSGYGLPFSNYMESKGLSWTAWVHDIYWQPIMFDEDWNLLGGENYMGQFTKDLLFAHRDEGLPGGGGPTSTPPGPTNTPTRTSTPGSGTLKVQLSGAGTDNNQQTQFRFRVQNTGTSAVSNISARVYFTTDGSNAASNYVLEKYYDQSGAATVSGPTQSSGPTYYFTVSYGTASLGAGSAWEFHTSLHLNNWASTYSSANDWWHGTGTLPTSYTDWTTIPAYVSGGLVWGSAPGGTPVPTNTPTRTNTPVGPTNTPTRTPTRTNTPVGPTNTPTRTPTRTNTPGIPTNTPSGGTCSPVNATISAPFTQNGAGTFCWRSSNLGGYINSWNLANLSINGVNFTNTYVPSGSYPAQIGGFWYVSYTGNFPWSHFEAAGTAGPTNTPGAPTNTPTRTNTPVGPTNTPTRTSTPTRTNTPGGSTNTPTRTPTNPPQGTHLENPFVGANFYRNVDYVASVNAAADLQGGTLGQQMRQVANYPTFVWLDTIDAVHGTGGYARSLEGHLDQALAQGANAIGIVVYDLPNRDCSALASNGELLIAEDGLNRYRTEYIDEIYSTISQPEYSNLRIIMVIEPDSLPNLITNLSFAKCAEANSTGAYIQGIQYAISTLRQLSNTYAYIDVAHHAWMGWPSNFNPFVTQLKTVGAGITGGNSKIDGFIGNTANYGPVDEPYMDANTMVSGQPVRSLQGWYDWNDYIDEAPYLTALRNALTTGQDAYPASIGMLIDTSRNGWGGPERPTGPSSSTVLQTFVLDTRVDRRLHKGNWCNQDGAGIGLRPVAAPATGFDAYVWVKPPGESDGSSSLIPQGPENPGNKGFDRMCDPTYTGNSLNGNNMTGALPNAPVSGRWFQEQFEQLVQNAFPAFAP